MRKKFIYRFICYMLLGTIMSFAQISSAQTMGNNFYLKYLLLESELSEDLDVSGFSLYNSPAKAFVLRRLSGAKLTTSLTISPVGANKDGEYSGSGFTTNDWDYLPTSLGISTNVKNNHGGYLHYKSKLRILKNDIHLNLYSGVQSWSALKPEEVYALENKHITTQNSFSASYHHTKNTFSYKALWIWGRQNDHVLIQESDSALNFEHVGNFLANNLFWSRKFSPNVVGGAKIQHIFFDGQAGFASYNKHKQLTAKGYLDVGRKNVKLHQTIYFQQNQDEQHASRSLEVRDYSNLGLTQELTAMRSEKNSRKDLLEYQHTAFLQNSAFFFNPSLKLQREKGKFLIMLGAGRSHRTPYILQEFASHYRSTLQLDKRFSTSMERDDRAFLHLRYRPYNTTTLQLNVQTIGQKNKILLNQSNDLDPYNQGITEATLIFNSRLFRKYKAELSYTYKSVESSVNKQFLPSHRAVLEIEGYDKYNDGYRYKFGKYIHLQPECVIAYQSAVDLQYLLANGDYAKQEAGFFSDILLNVDVMRGHRYSGRGISLTLGVTNLFNAGQKSGLEAIEALPELAFRTLNPRLFQLGLRYALRRS